MKLLSKLNLAILVGIMMFASCKKEEIVQETNNYYTAPSESTPANMKLLKEYGASDSTMKLTFTYYNGEKYKLNELKIINGGVAQQKFIINYDGSANPESYQIYSLPANTLDDQGTYEVDLNNNITKVITRNNLGDTTGIYSFTYILVGREYKVASINYFSQSVGDILYYDYFEYDQRGFMTKVTGYDNRGANLYKSIITEFTPSNVVNSLPNLKNYLLTASRPNLGSTAALYFSSYMPSIARTEFYNSSGDVTDVEFTEFNMQADADNNITSLVDLGIYFKY